MKHIKYLILFFLLLFIHNSICLSAQEYAGSTVKIIRETERGLVLEVSAPDLNVNSSKNPFYKTVSLQGYGTLNKSGAPAVPVKGVLIEIPQNCDLRVSAQPFDRDIVKNFSLQPFPKRTLIEDAFGMKTIEERIEPDEAIYHSDALFPGNLIELAFTGYLRDKRVALLQIYPIQYNPVERKLAFHKKMMITVCFKEKKGNSLAQQNDFIARTEVNNRKNDPFEKVYSRLLLNYHPGTTQKKVAGSPYEANTTHPLEIEESPFAVKAIIKTEGIYKISYSNLESLGIDLSGATNENLKMERMGQEIAIYCSGSGAFSPGDYILFYGKPFKSLYTKQNVYWLYQGSGSGKRMQQVDGTPVNGYPVQTAFQNTYRGEKDHVYWQAIPNGGGYDHWFWDVLTVTGSSDSKNFPAYIYNHSESNGNFSMRLNLRGKTDTEENPDHHTKVYINGNEIEDFTWNGQVELTRDITDINPSIFSEGGPTGSTITVEEFLDTGALVDTVYVNWFEIDYWDTYVAENDFLKFSSNTSGGAEFLVDNFSTNDIEVFDITDPQNVAKVVNVSVENAGGDYQVRFEDSLSAAKDYIALTQSQLKIPSALVLDEPSNLHSPRTNIDYIIITHDDFYATVQSLKDYRESKGLNVEVVKIQDIFDEFSYGIKDVQAIKDFLTYAYNNWNETGHPTYVLLVGDANVDYRDDLGYFTQGRVDFVPTYLFQTDIIGDTPTDNWYVCTSGSDYLPDMFIGRLSIYNEEDLQHIIDKIQGYESTEAGSWCKNVILAADDGNDSYDPTFEQISNELEWMLPQDFTGQKVYISQYQDPQTATSDLIDKINAGSFITNYAGHGAYDNWAAEPLFQSPDNVEQLANGDKLTFVMALNCLNGFFPSYLDDYSLAEEFLRAENKGAVACLAPTSTGYPSEHKALATHIFNGFFDDQDNLLGSVITSAKINAYMETSSRELLETFTIFGDPATELKLLLAGPVIELLTPKQNEIVSWYLPYTFTWHGGQSVKYKVQYSMDADFKDGKTITAPLLPNYIETQEYTPNIWVWFLLRWMCVRNDSIYWRVEGFDENNLHVEYSTYRAFSIER